MSKLLKLKEWLTVADAARHLSIAFGEDVTEADVLRLALDGRLRLSVYFVNHANAVCGKIVLLDEVAWKLIPRLSGEGVSPLLMGENGLKQGSAWQAPAKLIALLKDVPVEEWPNLMCLPSGLNIDGDRFLELSDSITTLRGVWDLPMIGNEQLDVEHQYQSLTGGPSVTLQGLDGAFVEDRDGRICQLQESFDDNEYCPGSNAALERLKQHIAEHGIEGEEEKSLLNRHKEQREEFLEERRMKPAIGKYYPAGGLPEDAVIVVRTEALRELEQSLLDAQEGKVEAKKIPSDNKLLGTIAALLAAWPKGKQPTGKDLEKAASSVGVAISDDTIRKALDAAREIAPTLPPA